MLQNVKAMKLFPVPAAASEDCATTRIFIPKDQDTSAVSEPKGPLCGHNSCQYVLMVIISI